MTWPAPRSSTSICSISSTKRQIFRIDHYLGKETVQNILVFRFGNGIFEPIWNRNYVDHVQITVAESLGVGSRGGYYDKSGAIRDMVQNHMMQLVALTAMEPPVTYDAESVRNQKVNVLRSIAPLDPLEVNKWVVRAQYEAGIVDGKEIPGYLETEGIPPQSTTETYLAWKLEIDNWRWNGVPFYIRTGKTLPTKVTEINVMFHRPPLMYFDSRQSQSQKVRNVITLRIQPDESIILSFDAKRPGPQLDVEQVNMDFTYSRAFDGQISDAYERLLLDAMLGDGTLFLRRDETELAWDRVTNVLEGWAIQEEIQRKRGRQVAPAPVSRRIRGVPPSPTSCWSRKDITGAIPPSERRRIAGAAMHGGTPRRQIQVVPSPQAN